MQIPGENMEDVYEKKQKNLSQRTLIPQSVKN